MSHYDQITGNVREQIIFILHSCMYQHQLAFVKEHIKTKDDFGSLTNNSHSFAWSRPLQTTEERNQKKKEWKGAIRMLSISQGRPQTESDNIRSNKLMHMHTPGQSQTQAQAHTIPPNATHFRLYNLHDIFPTISSLFI